MRLLLAAFALVVSVVSLSPLLGAEDDDEPKAEPPWVVDEDGYRQWKEGGEDCARCNGSGKTECERCKEDRGPVCGECREKREAKCRACGGSGETYDPMDEMVCTFCEGSALWTCGNCDGRGSYNPTGSGKKGQKCGPCKGSGSFKCAACKGKRTLSLAKVGRNMGDAKEHQLTNAREKIAECMRVLDTFKPGGKESDNREAFDNIVKDARGVLPALRGVDKLVDAGVKSLRGSAQYIEYETMVAREFLRFRLTTGLYMKSQIELIDLCLERLAFNDKVKAGE